MSLLCSKSTSRDREPWVFKRLKRAEIGAKNQEVQTTNFVPKRAMNCSREVWKLGIPLSVSCIPCSGISSPIYKSQGNSYTVTLCGRESHSVTNMTVWQRRPLCHTWQGSIAWQREGSNLGSSAKFWVWECRKFYSLCYVIHCCVPASCQWNIS